MTNRRDKIIKIRRVVFTTLLIFVPIILIILPKDFFDQGQSLSLFVLFGVGEYVYSTGMTRAIMHLIHLDFESAWSYNKLSFIVFPLLSLLWLKMFLDQIGKTPKLLRKL